MRKFLVPILFVLVLVLAGLALWALTENAGVREQSAGVLGHSEKHRNTGTVVLPPIAAATTTTTTAIPVPTTVPAGSVVAPVGTQPKTVAPTTTTIPVARAIASVATTTTSTTVTTLPPIVATAQIVTSGTLRAPDGSGCVANAQVECILLRATVNEKTGLTNMPPPGAVAFGIYDNAGDVVGTLVSRTGGGATGTTVCLLSWSDLTGTSNTGTSPDCSGTPFMSSSVISGFQYSATFTYVGQQTVATGELTY